MKIEIEKKSNIELRPNQFNITLEYSEKDNEVEKFVNYILKYQEETNKIIVINNNELVPIDYNDILLFYSDKKYNYCRTKDGSYKVKSKLYEIEKKSMDFIRISKSCIINIYHVKAFDISETGKIIVKLDDDTEEFVSRRRIKEIMSYLDERSV